MKPVKPTHPPHPVKPSHDSKEEETGPISAPQISAPAPRLSDADPDPFGLGLLATPPQLPSTPPPLAPIFAAPVTHAAHATVGGKAFDADGRELDANGRRLDVPTEPK